MISLVLELQRDALDKSVGTADLLRKALVVARKLKVTDLVEWLSHELNGYPEGKDVPEYRSLRGELKVCNPYQGWIPLIIQDARQAELLSKQGTSQAISELESIANSDGGKIYMRLPKRIEHGLMQNMSVPLEPAIMISRPQIYGLIDKVRNTVLEWALGLEEQGIMGEGMSFSPEEQRQASNVTLHVASLGSVIGTMHNSQIQQGTHNSTQTYTQALDFDAVSRVLGELRSCLDEAQIPAEEAEQIKSDIACVEVQLAAPKPNVSVIRESLRSTRSILEGLAGSAIFQGIITALGALS